jgi:hypothetical protein
MSTGQWPSWVGVITPHARQRYIERISSPKLFAHLGTCRRPSCDTCVSLAIRIRHTTQAARKYIDREIRDKLGKAQADGAHVKNPSFLEVIRKVYPTDRNFEFLMYGTAVFVIVNPADEPSPVLLTVMSVDMIDGMVIQSSTTDELTVYFDRWKREAKNRNLNREIKRL